MQSFVQDIRFGFRQLVRSPGLALIAVLSLALGIGATTSVFGIVYATLLSPYPFRDWDRITTLTVNDRSGNLRQIAVNGEQLRELRKANVVEEVMAFTGQNLATTGGAGEGGLPEDVTCLFWTTNSLDYLGVPPLMGRGFISADAPEGQEPQPVAMVSQAFWQQHFGGDPNILGQTIELAHAKYSIVGVVSPKLGMGGAEVFLPLKITTEPERTWQVWIRLKTGVTPEAASAALQPLLDDFYKTTPRNFPEGFKAHILPLSYGIRTGLGPSLYLLFGAVCLLLMIACLNVSILLLARGTRRQYELAVRAAMGASRMRVVRQLLTEAVLIAVVGETLGIALAGGLQKLLVSQLPLYLAVRAHMIRLNVPVLSFSIAATLVTVLVFGLLPAVQLSRRDLRGAMQLGTVKLAGGWGGKTRNALIAVQVAFSLVLLTSAATSIRTFEALLHEPLGYDPHDAVALAIPLHQNSYGTWEARAAFFAKLEEKIASSPAVLGASIASNAVPPNNGTTLCEILGQPSKDDRQVQAGLVGADYFRVLGISLIQGRTFDRTEVTRGARVAVINQAMARTYFPLGDALGKQIRLPRMTGVPATQMAATSANDWREVIGISADVMNNGMRDPVQPAVYVPYTTRMGMVSQIVVRTRGNPIATLRGLREQVQSVDSEQQVMRGSESLEQWIMDTPDWQREHMVALLFGGFAGITLLLAGVGLYSVVSYSVAQRTREFALRVALGAQPGDILRNVFFSVAGVVLVGVVAGIALQAALGRVVAQWAYAGGQDYLVLAVVVPLLFLVAIVACYVPARRAISVDPMQALRYE